MAENNEDRVTLGGLVETKLKALEKLLCFKISALEKEMHARLAELDRATSLASDALEERLEGMNEFRAQLDKQAGTFVSDADLKAMRILLEAKIDLVKTDVSFLREASAEAKGKASQQSVNLSTFLAVGGILMAAISLALKIFG